MVQVWQVVGGKTSNGIVVKEGKSIKTAELSQRLTHGAFVREIAAEKDRLHYKKLTGSGPESGWVSVKTSAGTLLEKSVKTEDEVLQSPRGIAANQATDKPSATEPAYLTETLPVALMFPGQGSQYVKMLDGVKHIPAVKEMVEEAQRILGWDVLSLCLDGPEDRLEQTKFCQPALFVAGMAGLEKLRGERPDAVINRRVVAGLSLGEYTALCAAGVFSFKDALELVKLRGEAMQEAAEASKQLMLSVAGLERDVLDRKCAEAVQYEGDGGVCQVANCLFPKGFACAGTYAAVMKLKELVEPDALQCKLLKTSGGFHTPLMSSAAEKLGKALDDLRPRMSSPKCIVYTNVTAEPLTPDTDPCVIIELLKKQLTHPVLWEPSVRAMIDSGIKEFYELGPMKQLKAMMKRIDMTMWKATTNVEV